VRDALTQAGGGDADADLIATSRVHWMLSRGVDVPAWYPDLLFG
jgi:hypothetical protein